MHPPGTGLCWGLGLCPEEAAYLSARDVLFPAKQALPRATLGHGEGLVSPEALYPFWLLKTWLCYGLASAAGVAFCEPTQGRSVFVATEQNVIPDSLERRDLFWLKNAFSYVALISFVNHY